MVGEGGLVRDGVVAGEGGGWGVAGERGVAEEGVHNTHWPLALPFGFALRCLHLVLFH